MEGRDGLGERGGRWRGAEGVEGALHKRNMFHITHRVVCATIKPNTFAVGSWIGGVVPCYWDNRTIEDMTWQ